MYANDRVAELQSVQNETHDRLEETLKNIERDNDDKDADLIAANREVEEVCNCDTRQVASAQCLTPQLTVALAWATGLRARRSRRGAPGSRVRPQCRPALGGRRVRECQDALRKPSGGAQGGEEEVAG